MEQPAKNDKKNQINIRKIKIKQRTINQREKDLKSKGDIKKCYKVVQGRWTSKTGLWMWQLKPPKGTTTHKGMKGSRRIGSIKEFLFVF